jgi:uncharacterized membrane protein YhaH (DUF805 family)
MQERQPQRMEEYMTWYLKVLKKYAVFQGRAHRKEYWMFFLFNFLIALGLIIVGALLGLANESGTNILYLIYCLAVAIPGISVTVRRLHDTGRSGWWFWITLIPFIGAVVLLVFMVLESQPNSNLYGSNPKQAGDGFAYSAGSRV